MKETYTLVCIVYVEILLKSNIYFHLGKTFKKNPKTFN